MNVRTTRRTASAPAVPRQRAPRRSGAGGTLIGLFFGLLLGLGLAAGVAYYLMKQGNPYQPSTVAKEAAQESGRGAKGEPSAPDKPRFDFYKILPGAEEAKIQAKTPERVPPDRATLERATTPQKSVTKAETAATERAVAPERAGAEKSAAARERFWLQAGSFANEPDAENLRARLALAGWEATVQQASVADKGTRYRVRLGPYDNTDELNRVKTELGKRGFDAAVIR